MASSLRAIALASFLFVAPQAAANNTLRVHFLDIGQGDAVLIVSPTGKTVLVDAGPRGGDRVVRHALASEGQTAIDLAVLSHAHADHIGGMAAVVEAVEVRRVLDPGLDHPSATYRNLLKTLAKHKVPVSIAREGRKIDLGGGVALEILAPTEPLISGTRSDANTNSIVLRLTHGSMSLLLTGDAEEPTERRLLERPERLASTILKVAHHGSRHSTTARFLSAVAPAAAVISCGLNNKYGHPHPETLQRLEDMGSGVFRTDLHGTVTLESTGSSWSFRTTRGPPVKIPDHGVVVAKAQAQGPARLNVNIATPEDLQSLPGIGRVKSRAIVDYRSSQGPFRTVSDLQRVRGIGPGILAKIKDLVTVKPMTSATTTPREP
jgi:competence ComEA-like helix-hairpin-helix protein